MTFEQIISAVYNLGVPVGVLAYVLWRGDKFLNRLIDKLDKFNEELYMINNSIRELIKQLGK